MFFARTCLHLLAVGVFTALLASPANLLAEAPHVVNSTELQNSVVSATRTRQRNIQEVKNFLSSDVAQKELKSAHIDPQQVKNAVSNLNDQELAQLASRAEKAQADFAAGNLGTRDVALIVLGVAIIILIVVVA